MKKPKLKYTLLFFAAFILYTPILQAQTWFELGTGANSLKAIDPINSICTDANNNVYAAGIKSDSDHYPQSKYYVAKWDAISHNWSHLGTGTNALNAQSGINTICADKYNNIYAAGMFIDSNFYRYVAKWDPLIGSWTELGTGANALNAFWEINTICSDDSGNIYAAGNFFDVHGYEYVAKWNGINWQSVGTLHANNRITSICVDDSFNVYAAGSFTDDSGHIYVAKWNHATGLWSELGAGFDSGVFHISIWSILVDSLQNVYATVNCNHGGMTNGNVFRWDGSSWHQLGALNANNWIETICRNDSGYIFAAGVFTDTTNNVYVAVWSPITMEWDRLGAGSNAYFFQPQLNSSINSMCIDKNNHLYASGNFIDTIYMPVEHTFVAEYGVNDLHIINPEFDNGEFEIFPNPANTIINIEAKNIFVSDNQSYYLSDISGKKYAEGRLTIATNKISQIDIKELPPGVYLLNIITDRHIIYKIIKN